MIDYQQINQARQTLGLGQTATLEEIKQAYRNLAQKYHPDSSVAKDTKQAEKKFNRIKQAYDTLMDYCKNYRFSFSESNIKASNPDMPKFYNDWF